MQNTHLVQALRARRESLRNFCASTDPEQPFGSLVLRRRFIRAAGAGMVAGAALGSQALRPQVLRAAGDDPIPVPGSPLFGGFHVWAPAVPGLDPIDAEPATITNFNGVVGIAYLNGTVRRTNVQSGAFDVLPFSGADMRFMQGVYRGVDGKPRQGTFGFI